MRGRLDLDDIGAPIAELANASWSRADTGKIENGKAGKGLGGPGKRHFNGSGVAVSSRDCFSGRHSPSSRPLSIGRRGPPAATLFIIRRNKLRRRLEKDTATCHMSP